MCKEGRYIQKTVISMDMLTINYCCIIIIIVKIVNLIQNIFIIELKDTNEMEM